MKQKKGEAPMQLRVVLKGDQRLAENVILEVRAIAKRRGLESPRISVMRQSSVAPKKKKATARKSGSRAGRKSLI
jgi:hypothetical protein